LAGCFFAAVVAFVLSVPAFGQIDFSGEWAPRFHEDQPERVAGPELGDYLSSGRWGERLFAPDRYNIIQTSEFLFFAIIFRAMSPLPGSTAVQIILAPRWGAMSKNTKPRVSLRSTRG
jgi:hypothetical protein